MEAHERSSQKETCAGSHSDVKLQACGPVEHPATLHLLMHPGLGFDQGLMMWAPETGGRAIQNLCPSQSKGPATSYTLFTP
jgi:hypothetical protein